MSTPVYNLVLGKGFTEAWYQLSKEQQDELWAKVMEVEKRAGFKWLILCNSRWANEKFFDWGVIEYPDMEAFQAKTKELEKLGWWRYWSGETILGTKMERG